MGIINIGIIMIKLKKHSEEDLIKVKEILSTINEIKTLSSKYYWIMHDYFKKQDRHPDRFDEISDDITAFFVEGADYQQLYHFWDGRGLPFFEKETGFGGFLMDEVSSLVHSKEIPADDRYNKLKTVFEVAVYLAENPHLHVTKVTNSVIDLAKNYSDKSSKRDIIKSKLMSYTNMNPSQIQEILSLI